MANKLKTKMFAVLVLLCCFNGVMAKKKLPPEARILNVWIEPNVNQSGGLVTHLDFDVLNWEEWIYIRLYIYDNEKKRWLGTYKNECCNGNGQPIERILVDEVKYPKGTSYRDVRLFIPLKYMQLRKGTNKYYASVEIGRIGETQARSRLIPFSGTGIGGPEGTNMDNSFDLWCQSIGVKANTASSHDYKGSLNDYTPESVKSNTHSNSISFNSNANNRSSTPSNSNYKSNQGSIKAIAGAILAIGALAAAVTSFSKSSDSSSSSSYSSSSSSSSYSSSKSVSVCSYCTGRGMMNCVWCYGSGIRKGGWFEADETCSSCKGQGQVWCYHCSGRGSR